MVEASASSFSARIAARPVGLVEVPKESLCMERVSITCSGGACRERERCFRRRKNRRASRRRANMMRAPRAMPTLAPTERPDLEPTAAGVGDKVGVAVVVEDVLVVADVVEASTGLIEDDGDVCVVCDAVTGLSVLEPSVGIPIRAMGSGLSKTVVNTPISMGSVGAARVLALPVILNVGL